MITEGHMTDNKDIEMEEEPNNEGENSKEEEPRRGTKRGSSGDDPRDRDKVEKTGMVDDWWESMTKAAEFGKEEDKEMEEEERATENKEMEDKDTEEQDPDTEMIGEPNGAREIEDGGNMDIGYIGAFQEERVMIIGKGRRRKKEHLKTRNKNRH